jgi:SAM-dependent methyltransferase
VLCLASGGGQQSAAFALLGAYVTDFDLSVTQLERDVDHYGVNIRIVRGDMRDLSCLERSAFDIVYQAYSIGFVPPVESVFREAANVIRPGSVYFLTVPILFPSG